MHGQPVLLQERHDAVLVLTLHRPEVRNALDARLRAELTEAVAAADNDREIGAIVLTGTDPVFCAGVDLKELADPAIAGTIGPRSEPFLTSQTPLIGAINGAAYTGGLELALACHFLIAATTATFADTHLRFGLTPGWGGTVLLPEAVGSRRARQLLTSTLPISAQTAHDWGLVNEVVSPEALLPRALEVARACAAADRGASRHLGALFNEAARTRDHEGWRIESTYFLGDSLQADGDD
jgi:enoyl-CoA hydratase